MRVIGLVLAAAVGLALPVRADDTDCARLAALVETPTADAVAAGAALIGGALGARLAAEVGRADVDDAVVLLRRAMALRCAPAGGDALVLSPARLAILDDDARFGGARTGKDLGDRLRDRVIAFIEALLESDAMVAFSEQTRTVYLTGLAVVVVVVAWRLRRRRPAGSAATRANDERVGVERQRARAFSALRAEALAVVAHDPRTALLLLRQALLARVGDVDADAARPSRTASEVRARLLVAAGTDVADVVTPALLRFDDAFYGGAVDSDAARALLALVDDAATRLERR